jgi:hypothetical protein
LRSDHAANNPIALSSPPLILEIDPVCDRCLYQELFYLINSRFPGSASRRRWCNDKKHYWRSFTHWLQGAVVVINLVLRKAFLSERRPRGLPDVR